MENDIEQLYAMRSAGPGGSSSRHA